MAWKQYIEVVRPAFVTTDRLSSLEAFGDSGIKPNNIGNLLNSPNLRVFKERDLIVAESGKITIGAWGFRHRVKVELENPDDFAKHFALPVERSITAFDWQVGKLAAAQSQLEAGLLIGALSTLEGELSNEAQLLRATALLNQNWLSEADVILDWLLKKRQLLPPKLHDAIHLQFGRSALKHRQFAQARKFALTIKNSSDALIMAHAHLLLGCVELAENKLENAILEFRLALHRFSSAYWWWGVLACQINLARAFLYCQDYPNARAWLSLAQLTSLPMDQVVKAEVLELSRELALAQPELVFEAPFFSSGSVRNELNLRLEMIKNTDKEEAALAHQELIDILDHAINAVQQADGLLVQQADGLLEKP